MNRNEFSLILKRESYVRVADHGCIEEEKVVDDRRSTDSLNDTTSDSSSKKDAVETGGLIPTGGNPLSDSLLTFKTLVKTPTGRPPRNVEELVEFVFRLKDLSRPDRLIMPLINTVSLKPLGYTHPTHHQEGLIKGQTLTTSEHGYTSQDFQQHLYYFTMVPDPLGLDLPSPLFVCPKDHQEESQTAEITNISGEVRRGECSAKRETADSDQEPDPKRPIKGLVYVLLSILLLGLVGHLTGHTPWEIESFFNPPYGFPKN